jgi:NAD(P)-dependent dehydrogenase (short-subunit alcohol dehydrogenase family)
MSEGKDSIMVNLSGKTALVTGASRGIGRASALAADLATPDGAHNLARQVRSIVGDRLDVLVANAGVALSWHPTMPAGSRATPFEWTVVQSFEAHWKRGRHEYSPKM